MKDASSPPTSTTPEAKPDASSVPGATPDPAKPADTPKPTVPETYVFKGADGRDVDQSLVDRATPVFKELGLDQASAEKLVGIWNDFTKREGERIDKAVNDMRAGWREDIGKDPAMTGKLEQIKADIGRMKDAIFVGEDGPAQRDAFEAAMNLTGAGDHPAIVRAWWRASEAFREGQHVGGAGPSKHGQSEPGTDSRPTLAGAMYPNLPH